MSLCELPPEGVGVDVVRKDLLAVDRDDRDQLAVALLELRVARDVDLLELELELRLHRLERRARSVAKAATRRTVENDATYGYRPRVVVASETRWTARP
jgi:hypothetical protein